MLSTLTAKWDLELGTPLEGGTAGYVVTAVDASGRRCVMKVAMVLDDPDVEAFRRSVRVHELAAGHACATLLGADESCSAMLLERLGPNLHELGLPVPRILEVVADTLRAFWRPMEPALGLPTGSEKASWLSRSIAETWEALGQPCDEAIIERAIELCERRSAAIDPERSVLVHGDAHGWNTVRAGEDDHKFVDPEGIWSEPEHDLAVPMREYNEPLLAGDTAQLVHERAAMLARRCDADPAKTWEWGFIERVSTGLVCLRDFEGGEGAAFLEVARRCL